MPARQAGWGFPGSGSPVTGAASVPSAPTVPARRPNEVALPPAASRPTHLPKLSHARSPPGSVPARRTTHSLAGAAWPAPPGCCAPVSAVARPAGTGGESDTTPGARRGRPERGWSTPPSPGWLAPECLRHRCRGSRYTTRRRTLPASRSA